MKSAYELAMERLNQKMGKPPPLSNAQKRAIADIDQRATARKAEVEILYRDRIREAREQHEPALVHKIEEELRDELARIRDRAEEEKEAVRRDASLS